MTLKVATALKSASIVRTGSHVVDNPDLAYMYFRVALVVAENPDLVYKCFRVTPVHSTTFIFTLYCPQDNGTVMFDRIAATIDNILIEYF